MKRFLFVVFVALSLITRSQSLFVTAIDKFTGERTEHLRTPIFITKGNSAITIDILKGGKLQPTLSMSIERSALGCTLQNHKIYFLFTDGGKWEAYNSARDCKGNVVVFMPGVNGINRRLPEKLMGKIISAVRVSGDNENFDFEVSDNHARMLQLASKELFAIAKRI